MAKREIKFCKECYNTMEAKGGNVFCSTKCKKIHRSENMLKYQEGAEELLKKIS